jgi:hypothetical protein
MSTYGLAQAMIRANQCRGYSQPVENEVALVLLADRINFIDGKRKIMRDLLREIGEMLITAEMTRADPALNEHGDARMLEAYSGKWIQLSLSLQRDLVKRIEAATS